MIEHARRRKRSKNMAGEVAVYRGPPLRFGCTRAAAPASVPEAGRGAVLRRNAAQRRAAPRRAAPRRAARQSSIPCAGRAGYKEVPDDLRFGNAEQARQNRCSCPAPDALARRIHGLQRVSVQLIPQRR